MTQISVQEQAVSSLIVSMIAHVEKGDTKAKRVARAVKHFESKFVTLGYSESEAKTLVKDAKDMADLNILCN
jgi:hypothetical protein